MTARYACSYFDVAHGASPNPVFGIVPRLGWERLPASLRSWQAFFLAIGRMDYKQRKFTFLL